MLTYLFVSILVAGEGKSGMMFWRSFDRKYVIKQLKQEEQAFLLRILPVYYNYMTTLQGSSSLLSRFLGMFKVTLGGNASVRYLVMDNVFAEERVVDLLEKYDIKGSLLKRYVTDEEQLSGVSVLKDLNFCDKHSGTDIHGKSFVARYVRHIVLNLDDSSISMHRAGCCKQIRLVESREVIDAIHRDAQWLAQMNIMDYSLLIGVGRFVICTFLRMPTF
jgi:hypothetical protein